MKLTIRPFVIAVGLVAMVAGIAGCSHNSGSSDNLGSYKASISGVSPQNMTASEKAQWQASAAKAESEEASRHYGPPATAGPASGTAASAPAAAPTIH